MLIYTKITNPEPLMHKDLLSIAPMIDWSHRHFRLLMRLLAPKAMVYTEMQTVGAILHKPERALAFSPEEHPLCLQLGGSQPTALADCAKLAEQAGFNEINLNLGCPSDKVQAGYFGACLMAKPLLVVDCLSAIKEAVSIPVTAKIRLGINNQDSYAFFSDFAHQLVKAGSDKLIIHARKAWLHGLNPKQNRTIPPINYPYVYDLKKEMPEIPVIINGNITTIDAVMLHLQQVDGVMLGRLACDNPYAIAGIHHALYPEIPIPTAETILTAYLNYASAQQKRGVPSSILMKPVLNLAHGTAGASHWKQQVMLAMQGKIALDQLLDFFPVAKTPLLSEG